MLVLRWLGNVSLLFRMSHITATMNNVSLRYRKSTLLATSQSEFPIMVNNWELYCVLFSSALLFGKHYYEMWQFNNSFLQYALKLGTSVLFYCWLFIGFYSSASFFSCNLNILLMLLTRKFVSMDLCSSFTRKLVNRF